MSLPTLLQLYEDIRHMENLVLYYQCKIQRKQVAVQEIITGMEIRVKQPEQKPEHDHTDESSGSVVDMVESTLPLLDGKIIWFSQLKEEAIKKYPDQDGKIRRGIYNAVTKLVDGKKLFRVPGGFSTKSPES